MFFIQKISIYTFFLSKKHLFGTYYTPYKKRLQGVHDLYMLHIFSSFTTMLYMSYHLITMKNVLCRLSVIEKERPDGITNKPLFV